MKKKKIQWIAVILLCAATSLLTACSNDQPSSAPKSGETAEASPAVTAAPISTYPPSAGEHTITVNSSEKVTVAPDIAQVVYAIRTENKEAAACQKKNTEDVNNVIQLLKELGVQEKSILTSDYTMYPIYNYNGSTQRITGYEAATTLTVSDLPIDNLGDILTQSVNTGINTVQSVSYSSSKYDEGYQKALKLAVESAKAKAEALAEAGGLTLGAVVNIAENSSYSEARYTDHALSSAMRSSGAYAKEQSSDRMEIMPGEVNIEVNITVSFAL